MEKLGGVLVPVFCRGRQPADGCLHILGHIFTVKVELSQLVFREVVAQGGCGLEEPDRLFHIQIALLGQPDLPRQVCGIGVVLFCGALQMIERLPHILRNCFALIEQLAQGIFRRCSAFFRRHGQVSDSLGDILRHCTALQIGFAQYVGGVLMSVFYRPVQQRFSPRQILRRIFTKQQGFPQQVFRRRIFLLYRFFQPYQGIGRVLRNHLTRKKQPPQRILSVVMPFLRSGK